MSNFKRMSWKNKHYNLTSDMIERGVIYASQLNMKYDTEGHGSIGDVHEVLGSWPKEQRDEQISNLKDYGFFKALAEACNFHVEAIVWSDNY